MISRPHIAADPAEFPRQALRVSRVCEILDCGRSEVYRLIRQGHLEAFNVGARSKRVYSDSVSDYQQRQKVIVKQHHNAAIPPMKRRATASTAAFRAAMIKAGEFGII